LNLEKEDEFYRWTYRRKEKRSDTRANDETSRHIFVNKDGKIVTGNNDKEEEE